MNNLHYKSIGTKLVKLNAISAVSVRLLLLGGLKSSALFVRGSESNPHSFLWCLHMSVFGGFGLRALIYPTRISSMSAEGAN